MKIQVIQEDIDGGMCGDSWRCPIALALWRITGVKYGVGPFSARPIDGSHKAVRLTERTISIIEHYDANGRMEPFEFELSLEQAA